MKSNKIYNGGRQFWWPNRTKQQMQMRTEIGMGMCYGDLWCVMVTFSQTCLLLLLVTLMNQETGRTVRVPEHHARMNYLDVMSNTCHCCNPYDLWRVLKNGRWMVCWDLCQYMLFYYELKFWMHDGSWNNGNLLMIKNGNSVESQIHELLKEENFDLVLQGMRKQLFTNA